jgi:NADH dehydrogenase FAD-containing subunit
MKLHSSTIAALLFLSAPAAAFAPSKVHVASNTRLYAGDFETVKEELKQKTSIVDAEDEIKYAPSNTNDETMNLDLTAKIERMMKPRAYPLFLAEKGAVIVEDTISSFTGKKNSGKSVAAVNGAQKERIVILGTGWGAAAFLKDIDTDRYDVTVISPRNHFLFTPMLAGASVGTVEYRSITESIREINLKVNYLEATATDIDPNAKTITCDTVVCDGNASCEIDDFTIEYDKIIMTVGAQTNTYGIPGVREYCCFLKQIDDAQRIRTAIVNLFERANLPGLTDEQKEAILTFAVIGAGPTGVEFASELRDFVEQDGYKYYPKLLKYVRIKVIEASPTVLAPFDKQLQQEAISQLTRGIQTKDPSILNLLPESFQLTELLLNSGVSEVDEDKIMLNDGAEIPYGLAVWAAGNGPLPVTLSLIDALGEGTQSEAQSVARGRVAIDPWLRVLGGDGDILAFGDCSCIVSGQLPATAQVASQQGEYLAKLFSKNYNLNPGTEKNSGALLPPEADPKRSKDLSEQIASFACQSGDFAAPFQFLNLGILAYTGGGSALAQLQLTPTEQARVKGTGKVGFGLWRSVYLSKQVSWRNRTLVLVDWLKTQVFGRDITRF